MGSGLSSLSDAIHDEGALIALVAYFLRGVVDTVLDGVFEAIGIEQLKANLRETTVSGVRAALSCSCCRASQEPAEKGAAVSAEEQRRRDEAEEAGIKALTSAPASAQRVPGVTLKECCDLDKAKNVSWEQTPSAYMPPMTGVRL